VAALVLHEPGRICSMRFLVVLTLLLLTLTWQASAQAQARSDLTDPSRGGQRARPFGFYMRGALGVGWNSASARSDVTTASETNRGAGEVQVAYNGLGATLDAFAGMRFRRALFGLTLIATEFESSPKSSRLSRLDVEPGSKFSWSLFGPALGVQAGQGVTWNVGGTVGWTHWSPEKFYGEPNTRVAVSQHRDSGIGFGAWAGPAWPLGRGWMLGAHLRAVTLLHGGYRLLELGRGNSLFELALLADVSFQSP
jgi:hypothetical protein